MANSTDWQIFGMRRVLELIDGNGGTMQWQQVRDTLREERPPSGEELDANSNGLERWWNWISWGTADISLAGAMEKDGTGVWRITPFGRDLLASEPDGKEFRRRIKELAAEENQARRQARADSAQRAWLVRRPSGAGPELLDEWLTQGLVSLAASLLPATTATMSDDEIIAEANAAYDHLTAQERASKVAEISSFVTKMKQGDLVLTTSDSGAYVGELGEGWSYVASVDGNSNLRRPAAWRNPEGDIGFGELPATLQAKLRTGGALVDLTAELEKIDALMSIPDDDDDDGDDERGSSQRRTEGKLPPLSLAVADELLVSQEWLQEFSANLNEHRQVVLYGPPGTGKTFLARKIAERLVGTERVRLVQFHPSYTYEDFFEGYRPAANNQSGSISLELRPGPLRSLATEARDDPNHSFILIIDELNRANIAKVFGELYFLLEYRDDAVEVMYGDEPFTLPKNLFFICTMNTADRSIALLDAAMRRRFAFMELHPAEEPTRSMLAKWLQDRSLPTAAASLLQRLNDAIDDRDAHIGPSYFMHEDQSPDRLRRVFRTQIEPLLRETFYERWPTVSAQFAFDRLWADATAPGHGNRPDLSSDDSDVAEPSPAAGDTRPATP